MVAIAELLHILNSKLKIGVAADATLLGNRPLSQMFIFSYYSTTAPQTFSMSITLVWLVKLTL